MIEQVIFAKDRATQIAATKALDRVLLWNFYVVPHYISSTLRYAGGTVSVARTAAEIRISGFPTHGGMTPTKRPGSASDLREIFAHGALFRRQCAGSRYRRRGVAAARGGGRCGPELHVCRCSAT